LHAPGAQQMVHLKNLLLSKPYFERMPDQSLIARQSGDRYDYQVATRGEHYAFVYTYNGGDMAIDLGKLGVINIVASWFNPRNGETIAIGEFENTGISTFDPPGEKVAGNDWVLVLTWG